MPCYFLVEGEEELELMLDSNKIDEDLWITVSWAGDLNHDGFFDWIIDISTHDHYGQ